jgi:hypothetical protein
MARNMHGHGMLERLSTADGEIGQKRANSMSPRRTIGNAN